MVRNQSVPVEYAVAAGLDADTSRGIRERRIIEDLIARDTRYRDRAREMAELVLDAKHLALSDRPASDILDFIEQKFDPGMRAGETAGRGDAQPSEGQPPQEELAPSASALQAIERNAATKV
jgi:hypothetical protein